MARTVVIDLRDFAGQAAGEHTSGRDKVMVWAPEFRASTQGGWTTGPLPRTFYFNGGPVKISGVEPGPIVMQFHVRQLQGQDTFTVNVPPGTGDVRLADLMVDDFDYDPPIISEAQRTLMSAREALTKATGLKQDVEKLTSETKDQLGRSVDKAQGDLNKAVDTAQANLNKAVETATTSWSNQLETMQGSIGSLLNSTRTTTEQILKDHKAQVAKSQKIQQDMQNVLDTISWSGDKLSVNGKQSPSLTGPRGSTGPRGLKGDPGASTWADVTGKPVAVGGQGELPVANGEYSTALGMGAKAENYSTAIGSTAGAAGEASTALGMGANSTGEYSTVLGVGAQSTKGFSLAIGAAANAGGENSIALGANTQSMGDRSVAIGCEVSESRNETVAIGKSGQTVIIAGKDLVAELATLEARVELLERK